MTKNKSFYSALLLTYSTLSLVGCGGSSGDNNNTQNSQTTTAPTWTAGSFEPSDNFKNYCDTPRTGNDPYNDNNPYPDIAATSMHEKMWLRSWSDETYLWYDEIADNNPQNFTSVAEYFAQLKTEQTIDSGDNKDNFHFSQPTEDFYKEAQSGVTSGYGINWVFIGEQSDRVLRVAYLEDNSPASLMGFKRGDTVLEVDGVSITDTTEAGVNTLNEGLFSPTNGDSHTIVVRSNDNSEKSFTITAANIEQSPVQNVKTFTSSLNKEVGYMQFNSHISIAQDGLIDAVNTFKAKNIDELIIDFRYNGGGLLAMSAQLAYMVAGPANIQNRYFYQTIQNNKQAVESPLGFIDQEVDYSTFQLKSDELPNLNLSKIYVLSTSGTCSASEAFINGLQGIDTEVILIGDTTCGKPYGFTPTHNCATTYYTIQFSGANYKGFGDYAAGFSPTFTPQANADIKGCTIADDFNNQLGDSNEEVLAAALYYIDNESCPIAIEQSVNKAPTAQFSTQNTTVPLLKPNKSIHLNNMDLSWPSENK
ncbi:peptidase [Pseudoalteromonas sp. MMG010]|uniref:S41 family peptidase n=1 Tax=Pseudoalteromonas sp. MMG010 TaxID=2822685 RepID=UPI001B39D797|nr:S41 family peptidase [Pseudoalteromonas sp. MMG010]MBQ4834314.1 peptidase [Pseudoalteromonas sp. MMG010]